MKIEKRRLILLKVIPLCIAGTLVVLLFYYLTATENTSGIATIESKTTETREEKYRYDKFWGKGVIISKYDGDRLRASISADRMVHRKRLSSLLLSYENLKELYLGGVTMDFYAKEEAAAKAEKTPPSLFEDIASSISFFAKDSTPLKEYLEGRVGTELDLLTRLVLDDVTLNLSISENKKLSIKASSAAIDIGIENFIFSGAVKITSSDNKELLAPKAVWSKKFQGIYLPNGHMFGGKTNLKTAFYSITNDGALERTSHIPDIDYKDTFFEKEQEILKKAGTGRRKLPMLVRGAIKQAKKQRAMARKLPIELMEE